jgi:hypothetical protein
MSLPLKSALAAAALCAATGSFAMVEHRVWYLDDMNYAYDYGDVALGNSAPLVPPSWACGRRFFDPDWYSWRGHYYEVLSSGNFYGDIHVWLPLGNGCPHDEIVVEKKNGSMTYAPPEGTHLLSIHSAHGGYWIDANGGWPACDCALAKPYLTLAKGPAPWGVIQVSFDQAVRLPFAEGLRLLDQASTSLTRLRARLARLVKERRGTSLGKLESTVRMLEDQAISATADAAEKGAECSRWMSVGAQDSAHRACAEAARSVDHGRSAMAVIAAELHR